MNESERRERTLHSKAFKDWWEVRSREEPIPSNKYQAYQIDKSLHAKIQPRPIWAIEPNRADQFKIDFPDEGVPTYAPAAKPPRRREAPEKSPELPKVGVRRELMLAAERMAQRHGIPTPTIDFTRESVRRSSTHTGVYQEGVQGNLKFSGRQNVRLGIAGDKDKAIKVVTLGTLFHEIGHDIHARARFEVNPQLAGIRPFSGKHKSYHDEQAATRIARTEIKRVLPTKGGAQAIANWDLREALQTYKEGWIRRGHPVKIEKGTNRILSGGEFPSL